jgi:hypothetical protein
LHPWAKNTIKLVFLRFFAGYFLFADNIYPDFNLFLLSALIRNTDNPGSLEFFWFDASRSGSLYFKLHYPPYLAVEVIVKILFLSEPAVTAAGVRSWNRSR